MELLKLFAYTGGEWVIYILLLCSVLALAVIIEKAVILRKEKKNFLEARITFQKMSVNPGLTEIQQELEQTPGFSAKVLLSILKNNSSDRSASEEEMNSVLFAEKQYLEKRILILGAMGSYAIYIGLFGTVLGVIKAFRDLAEQVGAGPEVVMQGLSEALIATAVGLMVAIPSVIAYTFYQNHIKEMLAETENMARILLAKMRSE